MKLLITIAALALVGCEPLGNEEPNTDHFPSGHEAFCRRAKDSALEKLESRGYVAPCDPGLTVDAFDGERFQCGFWQWKHDLYGWIGGATLSPKYILIARDPVTGEMNFDILEHEMAHRWLMMVTDESHPAKYKSLFKGWRG